MRIPWWHPVLGEAEAAAATEAILSGFPNDGETTEAFASAIAARAGCTHGVGVSSGSAAIYCALAACGVGPGDEVIVPDLTFIATANAVALTGATPVLVDVRRVDFGLDPGRVVDAITPRTRAIVPVHVDGRGAAIEAIVELGREHGLSVVEDASEALGSSHHGRPLGSFGAAATFSFAPSKMITTGQGGVIVTNDPELARRLRELKDQGRAERGTGGADEHPVYGFNFKLTNVQAAIGLAQLSRLDERLAHMRSLRAWYEEELAGLDPAVVLPPVAADEVLAWIDVLVTDRDGLAVQLRAQDIDPREFWFPLHTQPPYASGAEFPHATWVSAHGLWLPSALSLGREEVAAVGAAVRAFVGAALPV